MEALAKAMMISTNEHGIERTREKGSGLDMTDPAKLVNSNVPPPSTFQAKKFHAAPTVMGAISPGKK